MTVLLITVNAGLALNTDRTKGTLDRFRSMPIWPPSVIVGNLIGDAGRYLLATALVLGLGAVMGYHPGGGPAVYCSPSGSSWSSRSACPGSGLPWAWS